MLSRRRLDAALNIAVNTEKRMIEKVEFGIGRSLHQCAPLSVRDVSSYRLNIVIGLSPELPRFMKRQFASSALLCSIGCWLATAMHT